MTPSSPQRRPVQSVHLTTRGIAMLLSGIALLTVATLLGLPTILIAGAALILPPLLGWTYLRLSSLERGGNALTLERNADPNPTTVGAGVRVTAALKARKPRGRSASRLHSLGLSAQTPRGLATGQALKAEFSASFAEVRLNYTLVPSARGEWPLGLIYATRTDIFGVARGRTEFSEATTLRVRPAVLPPFDGANRASSGLQQSRIGASDPSYEDSSLRPYEPGDDLRRVHWASAAKHNEMMVRSNEGASPSPASVLLDLNPLPVTDAAQANTPSTSAGEATEWAVQIAASISLHLLNKGHPTRFITSEGTSLQPSLQTNTSGSGTKRNHATDAAAHAEILDQLISVRIPSLSPQTQSARRTTLQTLAGQTISNETLFCVMTPPEPAHLEDCIAALSVLAPQGSHRGIALVSTPDDDNPQFDDLQHELLHAGWSAVVVPVGSNLEFAWQEALRSAR